VVKEENHFVDIYLISKTKQSTCAFGVEVLANRFYLFMNDKKAINKQI